MLNSANATEKVNTAQEKKELEFQDVMTSFVLNMFENDLRNKMIKQQREKNNPFCNKSPNNENYLKICFCGKLTRGSRKNENQELQISKMGQN